MIFSAVDIPYVAYLDKNGKPQKTLPAFAHDKATLEALYGWMVLTRTFDEKNIKLQRTGQLGTYASSLGQEAIFVAIGHTLQKNDIYAPYYRDYGAMLQRGVTMVDILRYWGGSEWGSHYEGNAQDFPLCVPIATQCLHAAGAAKAIQYRNEKRVALATCGDGATSKGDFYETLNVAGTWKLPLVLVVNNNQWAISVPREEQTGAQSIAQKAIAAGIKGIQVDGNDIIALRDVLHQSIEQARETGQATLIEAMTYRLCDHTTADDASRYSSKEKLALAWQQEPITRLRQYMIDENHWNDEKEQALLQQCKIQVDAAVASYLETPKHPPNTMFEYLYATMPMDIQAQYHSLSAKENDRL
ncbi:MAG: pyruvate dehydrogenase (acetyl-transferring) E1 component subunit alpha [Gammaproteobacteria bacterium]